MAQGQASKGNEGYDFMRLDSNSPGTGLAQKIVTTYNNISNYQSIFEDCMEELQGEQRESGTSYSPHWNCAKQAVYR